MVFLLSTAVYAQQLYSWQNGRRNQWCDEILGI